MGRGRLILVNIIGIIIIFGLIAGGGYYYYQNTNYVNTDDARVAGDMATIVAPTAGHLTGWNIQEGDQVSRNATIGRISGGDGARNISAVSEGTVVREQVNENQLVQAGQVLAQTIDMNNIYITANIDENNIEDIEEGDSVDITIQGDPNTVYEGTLEKIGYATNSVFSLMPQQNASGNYTEVTQTIPVRISINSPSDTVLPGMNADVRISIK
ncbi:HlyD family efflux transporter periplasmic adaptor subunit [Bacillus sp. V5-8f]|uniref:HlyD family efflux transporter periplasmic adaptor subunit n=1 Tax=Bacillus sp. V5-8f TaxID=2053044 RepID=UPI000C782A9E|nr:HlyD family efflux transporter periplasmic adaptor subunit [Bacillus sp. V5-8f]PLT33021.1 transporter [Bacillus sp. V5-8f]